MNKRVIQILAVVVIVCALVVNGFAQSSGPGFSGSARMPTSFSQSRIMVTGINSLGRLLQNQEFVKMLELMPQQMTELRRIIDETTETRRVQSQPLFLSYTTYISLRDTEEGRQEIEENRQRLSAVAEAADNEMQAKVDEVLRPEQQVRLRESIFQLMGGLDSASLQERLYGFLVPAPTDIQKEQFRKLAEERDAEIKLVEERFGDVLRAPGETAAEARQRFHAERMKISAKYGDQMTSLLTPEQRAKAEKLTAEIPALRERLGLVPLPRPRAADAGR